jgi:hypothetical protein
VRASLVEEVVAFLGTHGPSTAREVGLGVRARRRDVDAVLALEPFCRVARPEGAYPHREYFGVSRRVPDARRRTPRAGSQEARILEVLRDGGEHSAAELLARVGFMHLNSRISSLRRKCGFGIERRQEGREHFYRLVSEPASLGSPEPVRPGSGDLSESPFGEAA